MRGDEITDPTADIMDSVRPDGLWVEVRPALCVWCRKEIYPTVVKRIRVNSVKFCNEECRQDYFDDLSLQQYKKHKQQMLAKYHATKVLKPKGKITEKKRREQERHKLYYQKHKEKLKVQMVEVRRKNKLKKQNDNKRPNNFA